MPVEFLLDPLIIFLSIISGIIVGLSLGLVGGGGSVLAIPLLLYLIGVKDVHVAIGTSALAVGIIAAISMITSKRHGNLNLKQGISFALPGIAGTLIGSQLGLWTPSENLLVFFAFFMASIGILMMTKPTTQVTASGNSFLILFKKNIMMHGLLVGVLAGYFGIGGGFLIVPTMMYSGGLNILQAVGTSLVSVSSFGFVTAGRYFLAENVDFLIAIIFAIGGILGGYAGIKISEKIPKENLVKIFSILLFVVSVYIMGATYLV